MDDKNENITIPIFAFERIQAKEEMENKRKNTIIIVLIIYAFFITVCFAVSQAIWIRYINQFEVVDDYSIEAEQDGSGVNIIGGGDIDYGTEDNDQKEKNNLAP